MCLRVVVDSPGTDVTEIAEAVGIAAPTASVELRALQARGLIAAHRESRWVRYFPEPDPLVPSARLVLQSVAGAFKAEESLETIMKQVTAFTHPRRLLIIQRLQHKSPLDILSLAAQCNMSVPAAFRHVRKLVTRDIVSHEEEDVALLPPTAKINRALLALIARGI
jgi:DNA-binding transcriptional ArsR family regulator